MTLVCSLGNRCSCPIRSHLCTHANPNYKGIYAPLMRENRTENNNPHCTDFLYKVTVCRGKSLSLPAASPVFFKSALSRIHGTGRRHFPRLQWGGGILVKVHWLTCPSVCWIKAHFSQDTILTKRQWPKAWPKCILNYRQTKPEGKQKEGRFRWQSGGKNTCPG